MEKYILERYTHTPDGKVIIDIAASKIEDLFSYYDRSAPYLKKDLDQELVDYIVDACRDIGNAPFILQFSIDNLLDEEAMSRLRQSIPRYFLYLKELEIRDLKRMFRTSTTLLLVGLVLLTLSVWVNLRLETDARVISHVFAAGLTVAAWVSLWEALATFLINWLPHRRRIKRCNRIANAPIHFSQVKDSTDH